MCSSKDKHIGSIHAIEALIHAAVAYYHHDTPEALELLHAARAAVSAYVVKGINEEMKEG